MKRKHKKKILLFGIIGIILIVVVLLFCFLSKDANSKFLGTWVSEGGTIYEFREKNEGVMKTFLSEYKYTYKVKGNILSIDFEEEKAVDTDYEYSCQKNKCSFKSDRGTFVFTKR